MQLTLTELGLLRGGKGTVGVRGGETAGIAGGDTSGTLHGNLVAVNDSRNIGRGFLSLRLLGDIILRLTGSEGGHSHSTGDHHTQKVADEITTTGQPFTKTGSGEILTEEEGEEGHTGVNRLTVIFLFTSLLGLFLLMLSKETLLLLTVMVSGSGDIKTLLLLYVKEVDGTGFVFLGIDTLLKLATGGNLGEVFERIDSLKMLTVGSELDGEMEMGAGGIAGRTGDADLLAVTQDIAFLDINLREMTIADTVLGTVITAVFHNDIVTADTVTADLADLALGLGTIDGGVEGPEVNTVMAVMTVRGGITAIVIRQDKVTVKGKTVESQRKGGGFLFRRTAVFTFFGIKTGSPAFLAQTLTLKVVLVEVVVSDLLKQGSGIVLAGGITSGLKTFCPAFIIRRATGTARGIAGTHQELGMVTDTLLDIAIVTELFSFMVIVIITIGLARRDPPRGTLDAEEVISLTGKLGSATPGFEIHLRQGDGGGNTVSKLLGNSQVLVFLVKCFFLWCHNGELVFKSEKIVVNSIEDSLREVLEAKGGRTRLLPVPLLMLSFRLFLNIFHSDLLAFRQTRENLTVVLTDNTEKLLVTVAATEGQETLHLDTAESDGVTHDMVNGGDHHKGAVTVGILADGDIGDTVVVIIVLTKETSIDLRMVLDNGDILSGEMLQLLPAVGSGSLAPVGLEELKIFILGIDSDGTTVVSLDEEGRMTVIVLQELETDDGDLGRTADLIMEVNDLGIVHMLIGETADGHFLALKEAVGLDKGVLATTGIEGDGLETFLRQGKNIVVLADIGS